MRAAVYDKDNLFKIEKINKPELVDNGAIIKVLGCGLCGSDIVKMKTYKLPSGTVLGHEVVGELVDLKKELEDFTSGDLVPLGDHVPCFECVFCKNHNYSMCKEFKKTNILPGGFCEYIFVSDEHLKHTITKVPQHTTLQEASFMEPVACCIRAVKRACVKKGDNVFVIGLGSIGLLIGQIAKYYGAKVTGCDLKDERLEIATEKGFDKVIHFESNEASAKKYKKITNDIGADIVFLSAGASSSVDFSINCVRDGGTILVFSSVASSDASFLNNEIYYRELTVLGSYSPSPDDLKEAMSLIENGCINVKSMSTVYELEDINRAIKDTLQGDILKAYIRIG